MGVKDGTLEDGCIVVGRTLGELLGERVGANEGDAVDGVDVGITDVTDVGVNVGCIVDGVDVGVTVLGDVLGLTLGELVAVDIVTLRIRLLDLSAMYTLPSSRAYKYRVNNEDINDGWLT